MGPEKTLADHADGRDHRVEREDDVEQEDLHDHAPERRRRARRDVPLHAFELLVDLVRALRQPEEASDQQNQIAAGDLLPEHGEQRRGEPDDPGQGEQQRDADEHGEREPDASRPRLLLDRELARQNRDEHDVVDAEHDLERRQRRERDPDLGVRDPLHGHSSSFIETATGAQIYRAERSRRMPDCVS
jgi:hypothetical protein